MFTILGLVFRVDKSKASASSKLARITIELTQKTADAHKYQKSMFSNLNTKQIKNSWLLECIYAAHITVPECYVSKSIIRM